jgi:choline dehydrogenase-like flavoprotein
MAPHVIKRHAEAVVVGSGPGGATVARQLARARKKVILVERGKDYRRKAYYGQTEVKTLFVCDASSFPEALDRPTVLTILALGKRLAAHVLEAVIPQQSANTAKLDAA